MIALLLAVALGGEARLVPVDGPLHAGLVARVELGLVDDAGEPVKRVPRLVPHGAEIKLLGAVAPGVWSLSLTPAVGQDEVRLDVLFGGELHPVALPVSALQPSTLELPERVDALVSDETVRFVVRGSHLPAPEALVVAAGEGEVASVEAVEGGLAVTLRMADSPYARSIPVGLLDTTRDELPAWTRVRLRARPRLNLRTEPGSQVVLTVGGRSYGPFIANESGSVGVTVDQYPSERAAEAVFTDSFGNSTRTSLPLSTQAQDAVVSLVSGPIRGDGVPPRVFVALRAAEGGVRRVRTPECRTPSGELAPLSVPGDQWLVPLPDQLPGTAQDLRLRCEMGEGLTVRERVAVVDGVGARLRMRVWPEELSSDFPVSEVSVAVEDARGERLPVDGLSVEPEVGSFEAEESGPFVLRGEYLGRRAISAGGDRIVASYQRPAGGPEVGRVVVRHGPVPDAGAVQLFARALDRRGRPVPEVELLLDAEASPVAARTGADGWATAIVELPEGTQPLRLRASDGAVVGAAVALRGSSARGGPSQADLSATTELRIEAGRVESVNLRVDPPVLYTGPGSVAQIVVEVADRSGGVVADAPVDLTVSEGTLGALRQSEDGTWHAEFTPPPGDRARDITFTARSETATGSTRMSLQPRPLVRAPSVGIGAITNFGRVTSPMLTVDTDWRIPVLGGATILRVGFATYTGQNEVDTGVGGKNSVRMTLVPIQVALLARRELGARALWLGLGGVVAPYAGVSRFNEEVAASGVGVLPPGLTLSGGLGQRFGGGEVMLEARGIALASSGGPISFQGPVGGVALVVGYRLIY